jgi:hypothetical protein
MNGGIIVPGYSQQVPIYQASYYNKIYTPRSGKVRIEIPEEDLRKLRPGFAKKYEIQQKQKGGIILPGYSKQIPIYKQLPAKKIKTSASYNEPYKSIFGKKGLFGTKGPLVTIGLPEIQSRVSILENELKNILNNVVPVNMQKINELNKTIDSLKDAIYLREEGRKKPGLSVPEKKTLNDLQNLQDFLIEDYGIPPLSPRPPLPPPHVFNYPFTETEKSEELYNYDIQLDMLESNFNVSKLTNNYEQIRNILNELIFLQRDIANNTNINTYERKNLESRIIDQLNKIYNDFPNIIEEPLTTTYENIPAQKQIIQYYEDRIRNIVESLEIGLTQNNKKRILNQKNRLQKLRDTVNNDKDISRDERIKLINKIDNIIFDIYNRNLIPAEPEEAEKELITRLENLRKDIEEPLIPRVIPRELNPLELEQEIRHLGLAPGEPLELEPSSFNPSFNPPELSEISSNYLQEIEREKEELIKADKDLRRLVNKYKSKILHLTLRTETAEKTNNLTELEKIYNELEELSNKINIDEILPEIFKGELEFSITNLKKFIYPKIEYAFF